jgi:hypothetical protein
MRRPAAGSSRGGQAVAHEAAQQQAARCGPAAGSSRCGPAAGSSDAPDWGLIKCMRQLAGRWAQTVALTRLKIAERNLIQIDHVREAVQASDGIALGALQTLVQRPPSRRQKVMSAGWAAAGPK